MSDDRLRLIQTIFHGAMERTAAEREAYVAEACAGDASLKDDVLSFVAHAAAASADGFMKGPAIGGPDAPPERMLLTAGTRLGPYEIVDAIGAGGMGEVYRARDTRLGRAVAIKILPSDVRKDRQVLVRFEREARAIAGLNHPNICTLHDIGHHEGIDFLVMEHIEGQTLRNKLRGGALSIEQTTRIATEVADALAAAHRQGLVHRDIKPSNIIVTPSGHAKVVDFGLARLTGMVSDQHVSTDATETGVIIGTPNYMSPEQARGSALDQKTDVFSLGVVVFECLTGRLPFDGDTREDYLKQLMSARPHQVSEFKSDVPLGLQTLVMRCLERDASARIDAAELMHLSRPMIEGTASGSWQPPPPLPWWRRAAPVVAGVLITAGVLIAAWYWLALHPIQPGVDTRLSRVTIDDGAETDSRFSPDGQWILYIKWSADGLKHLFLQQVGHTDRQAVTLPPGRLQNCVWSDDDHQKSFACLIASSGLPGATDSEWAVQIVPTYFGSTSAQSFRIKEMSGDGNSLLHWIGGSIYMRLQEKDGQTLARLDLATGQTARVDGPWTDKGAGTLDIRSDARKVVWWVRSNAQRAQRDELWIADVDGNHAKEINPGDTSTKRYPIWMGASRFVIYQSNRGGQMDLWQVDTVTGQLTQRTSDLTVEQPESALTDGSLSFRVTSEKTDLIIWPATGGPGAAVSEQSLSDFLPTASATGRVLAFLRTKNAPGEGFPAMDAEVFVARDPAPTARLDADLLTSGLAPRISPDGRLVAYMLRGEAGVSRLLIAHIDRSGTDDIASNLPLPSTSDPRVVTGPFTWASSNDLYFTQFVSAARGPVRLVHRMIAERRDEYVGEPANYNIADVVATSDGRTIAYLSSADRTKSWDLCVYETTTGKANVIHKIPVAAGLRAARFTFLHGFTRDDSALVVTYAANRGDNSGTDFDVLTLDRNGKLLSQRGIDHVVPGTVRLIPALKELYVTRMVKGVANVFAYSLGSEEPRQVSTNVLLDVSFGSVEPLGPNYVIGAQNKRSIDIHTSTPAGGRVGR